MNFCLNDNTSLPLRRVEVRIEVPSSGMNPINNEGSVTDDTLGSQRAKLITNKRKSTHTNKEISDHTSEESKEQEEIDENGMKHIDYMITNANKEVMRRFCSFCGRKNHYYEDCWIRQN